jgi:hypothetical protein
VAVKIEEGEKMKIIIFLLFALPVAAQSVAVGNCQPHLVSYSTISAAVAAAVSGGTVLVCPGTYPEQVVITQPLTLRGLNLGTVGVKPVITVPSGGLVLDSSGDATQLSVLGVVEASAFGPVNISNLVVDGTGAQFTCPTTTTGNLIGIGYTYASGTLTNVTAQNQAPGGCGEGISLTGDSAITSTVNIQNSSVLNFDGTGIYTNASDYTEEVEFFVNLTADTISSANPLVYAGIETENTSGLIERSTVTVAGQYGIVIYNLWGDQYTQGNTVTGGLQAGIFSGASEYGYTNVIGNSVFNSSVGIATLDPIWTIIKANKITNSSIAAINMDCSGNSMAEGNTIFGAPVGIENATGNLYKNTFYNVTVQKTECMQ